jgi:hypothetical protein
MCEFSHHDTFQDDISSAMTTNNCQYFMLLLHSLHKISVQIGQLTADVVRLVAQLEKGEVMKQNLEYELAKAKKDLAAERQLAFNREADTTDAVAELQRMFICSVLETVQAHYA